MQHTIRSIFSWAKIGGDTPEPPPIEELSTTLFSDGTLIINEWKTKDREANIASHGAVLHEYEPWDKNNPETSYVWTEDNLPPWYYDANIVHTVLFGDKVKPIDMSYWFREFTTIQNIDSSNLDTSRLEKAVGTFYGCEYTRSLDLSSWDTSALINASEMFSDCYRIESIDLSGWDTRSLQDSSRMFASCYDYEGGTLTIYASDKFVTSQIITDREMFKDTENIIGGAGTTYDSAKIGKEYAHIDNPPTAPGYFTAK